MFSGTISFHILLDWGYSRNEDMPWESWWSRLARRCSLIRDNGAARWYMVLLPAKFGLMVHLDDEGSDNDAQLLRLSLDSDGDPITVTQFPDPRVVDVHRYQAVRDQLQIRMKLCDTPPTPLVKDAFLNRHSWSKWELEKALLLYTDSDDWHGTIPKLRSALIEQVFDDTSDRAYVLELYRKDVVVEAVPEDENLMALLEELAFDDFANAQEMKDTKAELSKTAIRSLQKRRREHRADRFLL